MNLPGRFITIEGGEGSGKSTLIAELNRFLTNKGYSVLVTREPGGTLFGEKIRELLLEEKKDLRVGLLAELFLFLASRSQHIEEVIKPALISGRMVLCDRFNDSTIAYQGIARGLGRELVEKQCHLACQGIFPDLTLFLDLDPELGLKRRELAEGKSREKDRIENAGLFFHESVRKALLFLAKENPDRIHVIDASFPKESVLERSLHILQSFLKRIS